MHASICVYRCAKRSMRSSLYPITFTQTCRVIATASSLKRINNLMKAHSYPTALLRLAGCLQTGHSALLLKLSRMHFLQCAH